MRLTDSVGAFTGCSATGRNISFLVFIPLTPMATRSKMLVFDPLLTGIVGSKFGCMNLLGFCVCCKAVVSATG